MLVVFGRNAVAEEISAGVTYRRKEGGGRCAETGSREARRLRVGKERMQRNQLKE